MWIFLNDSMLSVVSHRSKPEHLLVRGRIEGDIDSVFPHAKVMYTPTDDYGYRAIVSRAEVAQVMKEKVLNIDYDNFKSSVSETGRHDAYFAVWNCMYQEQQRRWENVYD